MDCLWFLFLLLLSVIKICTNKKQISDNKFGIFKLNLEPFFELRLDRDVVKDRKHLSVSAEDHVVALQRSRFN